MYAGRLPGPAIEIAQAGEIRRPDDDGRGDADGARGALYGRLHRSRSSRTGKQTPLVSFAQPGTAEIKQDGPDRVRVTRTFGRNTIPDLKSGPARILVTAERPVLYGMRKTKSTASRDVQVRLEKPTIAVLSTKHYINLGGSEMVVYRATPADVDVGRAGRRPRISRLPRERREDRRGQHHRSRRQDRVHRAPLRPGRQHADVRASRGTKRATPRAPTSIGSPSPSRSRRAASSWTKRSSSGSSRRSSRRTNEVNPQGSTIEKFVAINSELRRKNAEKIASYAAPVVARDALGRRDVRPVRQRHGRSGVRGSAHLHLRREGGRPADPSRLRPRARRQLADPGRATAARSCTPVRSAFTATP